ncbi:MAG: class I SAM-dependent methyltransferase [Ferrimicrobium sp.]
MGRSVAYSLNLTRRGGTHSTLLGLIPEHSRVLELGCASGYFGTLMQQRGCKVWGIDSDAAALARIPEGVYESVSHADLDSGPMYPLPLHSADVVLAADVLEHLREPAALLSRVHEVLAPWGLLIVSIPNVAHVSVRFPLLFGKFQYQSSGILDRTHLHFYTFASACELIDQAGFEIEGVLSGSDWSGVLLNQPVASRVAKVLRGLLATGIIITARPRANTDFPNPRTR